VNAPDGLGRTPLAISHGADVAAALIRIGAKCEARPVLSRCAVILWDQTLIGAVRL
jgi:hypothetical protein